MQEKVPCLCEGGGLTFLTSTLEVEDGALSSVMGRSGLLCRLALPHKVKNAKNDITDQLETASLAGVSKESQKKGRSHVAGA